MVLALAAVVLVTPAPPASACSCMAKTAEESFAGADAVFVGSVVGRNAVDRGKLYAHDLYEFEVSGVYKGDVAATQRILSPPGGGACGLGFTAGTDAIVFASTSTWGDIRTESGELWADMCNGSRRLATGDIPASFGAVQPPTQRGDSDEAANSFADRSLEARTLLGIAAGAGGAVAVAMWAYRRRRGTT